jgi:DNA-binding GntR family transcriptional regulator
MWHPTGRFDPSTSSFAGAAAGLLRELDPIAGAITRSPKMTEAEIGELKEAVERAHRCPATYRTTERVREQNQQFEVAVFDILGHPRVLLCYAWFEPASASAKRRAITVLREGPVHTSADAVRSALDDNPA